MKFIKSKWFRSLLLSSVYALGVLGIVASGGGSGGGDDDFVPTDPNTVFKVFPPEYFTNYSKSINYSGSDTAGGKFVGTFSEQTQSQTTFLGELAIPILVHIQLTNTVTNAITSNIGRGYYSTSANDRRNLGYSDGSSTTVSAITFAIPETGRIGDFGVAGTYTENTGSVTERSWRIDDGGNGRAKLVLLTDVTDQFNDLETSGTTVDLIDVNGNVISRTLTIYFADLGITLTLTSN
jgi:hypothetical protein